MNDRKDIEKVQIALDTTFSALKDDPWLAQRVLAQAKSEVKVKKKLSVGFVLVIILVLAATVAVASVALQAYYEKAFETQNQAGYYQQWPLADKIELVDRMVEANLEIDLKAAARLHDDLSPTDKEALADKIVTEYYGVGHDGVLSVVNMMEKDMGEMATWSLEEKAWVSEQQVGFAAPEEKHTLPGALDISPEKATELARAVLCEQYGLSADEVASYRIAVDFMQLTDDTSLGGKEENVYQVSFYTPFSTIHPYSVLLTADGTLIHSSRPFGMDQDINEVFAKATEPFRTPADKAAFRQQWSATILKAIENGEDVWDYYQYLSTIDYITPNEKYISQETAQANAEAQLSATLGWSHELLMCYEPFVSLRRTVVGDSSTEQAIWYFKYVVNAQNVGSYWGQQIPWGANVAIDATTGEATIVEESTNDDRYSMYNE